ncbi:hypothetical protein D3C84_1066550 [compost metagenome]
MNVNNIHPKNGWIFVANELAALMPDPATVAALTPVSVANATDLATAVALANANKVAINAIIAALKDLT